LGPNPADPRRNNCPDWNASRDFPYCAKRHAFGSMVRPFSSMRLLDIDTMGLVVVPIPEQMAQAFDIDLNVVQRCPMLDVQGLEPCTACSMWRTRIEM
jgi:hypothetical protein